MNHRILFLSLILLWMTTSVIGDAQESRSLNQLEHREDYPAIGPGGIGSVQQIGTGPDTLFLIPGLGFDQSIFYPFMMRNQDKLTCYAFTPAGMGLSLAPQMSDLQYGDRPWSTAFEQAILQFMDHHSIRRAALLGFFAGGVQHAIQLAHHSPERFSQVFLVGGELFRVAMRPLTPGERSRFANQMAENWFKTVDSLTWYNGVFTPDMYSLDSLRGQRIWDRANHASIPTLIQYLLEFLAVDLSDTLANIQVPTLILTPGFTKAYWEIPDNQFVQDNYVKNWENFMDHHADKKIEYQKIPNSAVFLFSDQPQLFDQSIVDFIHKSKS